MKQVSSPLILKIRDQIVEILFKSLAENISLKDGESVVDVQSFLDNLKKTVREIEESLKDCLTADDIVNSLDVDDEKKALSAALGKEIKRKLNEVKASSYYTDLDVNSREFKELVKSLPDGALISVPEDMEIQNLVVRDLDSISLYDYCYSAIVLDRE